MRRVCLLTGGASLAVCYQNSTTRAQILNVLHAHSHTHTHVRAQAHTHTQRKSLEEWGRRIKRKKKNRDYFRLHISLTLDFLIKLSLFPFSPRNSQPSCSSCVKTIEKHNLEIIFLREVAIKSCFISVPTVLLWRVKYVKRRAVFLCGDPLALCAPLAAPCSLFEAK